MSRPAVITGLGAVSALGRGAARMWTCLAEGQDGLRRVERFDPSGFGPELAGVVPDRNTPAHGETPPWQLCVEFAIHAGLEAASRAGLARSGIARERIALVLGTSLGDPDMALYRMTERVADAIGIAGPRITVSTACTSSTNALGLALDLLRLDAADAVVAGGSDVLTPLIVAGFQSLGVLSKGKCAPFSEPPGTSLGEGAGFLVVERAELAARRGAVARFALLGCGLSADAFHDTGPDPTGAGVARAMRAALDDGGVAPADVDYVNAHGTGTRANDPAEWRAIQQVFGERAGRLPVSSSKSFLGHAQGAAGILELIATLVAMERGAIPPTHHFTVPRPHGPPDPVAQATPRPARCRVALCTSSAFGGANCAVVIGRTDRDRNDDDSDSDGNSDGETGIGAGTSTRARAPVYVAGLAAIGPHGIALDALDRLLGEPGPAARGGRVTGFRLADALPTADPRGLDPCSRYLTGAAALALADAGLRAGGAAGQKTGLIAGVNHVSAESNAALVRTIRDRGYRGMSASLFSRMVLNAPVGTCSKLLGIKGALSTVSAGDAAGLLAILYAAELVAARPELDAILAGGVDELPPGDVVPGASEGAACVLLASARPATRTAVRLAGSGIAGPGRIDAAARAALAAASIEPDALDAVVGTVPEALVPATVRRIDPDALAGASEAFTSALAFVAGSLLVRSGAARRVLVARAGGGSADCAIALVREEELHAA